MQRTIRQDDVTVDFYTAPEDESPAGIEGTTDSIISAAAVLKDIQQRFDEWDGVSHIIYEC